MSNFFVALAVTNGVNLFKAFFTYFRDVDEAIKQ